MPYWSIIVLKILIYYSKSKLIALPLLLFNYFVISCELITSKMFSLHVFFLFLFLWLLFRNWAFVIFDALIRSNYEYTIPVVTKFFSAPQSWKNSFIGQSYFFEPIKDLFSFSNWEILLYKIGENRIRRLLWWAHQLTWKMVLCISN